MSQLESGSVHSYSTQPVARSVRIELAGEGFDEEKSMFRKWQFNSTAMLLIGVAAWHAAATQAFAATNKNATKIKALEKQLADTQKRMNESNRYYEVIKSDLKKSLIKVQRANSRADLAAAVLLLPLQIKSLTGIKTFKDLGKNLAEEGFTRVTKVTEPSAWASLYGRVANYAKTGKFSSVEQELKQTLASVEEARMNTGIEYVRRIQVLKNQIASLKSQK